MNKTDKILVLGGNGLVGKAIIKKLISDRYTNVHMPNRDMLDLTNNWDTIQYFYKLRPQYIFLAAAKVGGILANSKFPADFGHINGMIELNVLQAAYLSNRVQTNKLLFLGSSCIYPRDCPQPIKEEYLLSGYLEKTNELYALAKILGLKLCEAYRKQNNCNFISCMPTNLYGPNDNFDLETSHVLPALIRKVHEASIHKTKVEVWGDGSPMREFLYIDDLADACVFLMKNYNSPETINIGTGIDITIKNLVETICDVVEFDHNNVVWDTLKPNGTPRKLLDVSKINNLGWKAQTDLITGIKKTYEWYKNSQS